MPGPDFDEAERTTAQEEPSRDLEQIRRRLQQQVARADLPALQAAEQALAAGSTPHDRESSLPRSDPASDLLRRADSQSEAQEEAAALIRRNEEIWRRWLGPED